MTDTDGMHLDETDLRIIGALQVDGRASWRTIAKVLGIPLTTVVRRGNALLEAGIVTVTVMGLAERTAIIEVTTESAQVDSVAHELASRPETVFVYALSSPTRLVLEQYLSQRELAYSVLEDIPSIPGVLDVTATPVLDYHKTLTQWMPDLITADEAARLNPQHSSINALRGHADDGDRAMLEALAADGRTGTAQLAEVTGYSTTTVRKRLERLLTRIAEVRAVVSAENLGLSAEAFLWVSTSPGRAAEVADAIASNPFTKYVVTVLGEHQIVADVAMADYEKFREFLADEKWAGSVRGVRASTVLRTYKSGGVVA
ncbi:MULTISPECIES: Lrp/AsnC family transcriptional regulator [Brevibacterium]|nr:MULTISPECIES: Lrp/AsnC family transcriptional regulator [Brevibacterium]